MLPKFPLEPFNEQPEPLTKDEGPRVEPTTADGNRELAEEHIAKGHVSHAITRYKKAARMDSDPSHRTNLGDAYAFAELTLKAVEQYRRAIKSNPKRSEPHFSLAEVYVRYGKWQAAKSEFGLAAQLTPDNAFYQYKYANACIQVSALDEAISALEDAVSLSERDAFYRFELAALYADVGRNEEAINQLENAVTICPEDDYYMSRLGMLYARVGRFERAADALREAIAINPEKLCYRWILADMYRNLGFESRAQAQLDEAAEIDRYEADFVERAKRYIKGEKW